MCYSLRTLLEVSEAECRLGGESEYQQDTDVSSTVYRLKITSIDFNEAPLGMNLNHYKEVLIWHFTARIMFLMFSSQMSELFNYLISPFNF